LTAVRIASRPRIAFVALAFAVTAWASPPSEKTAGHTAIPATATGSPKVRPGNPSPGRPIALVNADFESAALAPDGGPEGWYSYQHTGVTSYLFARDEAVVHGGARSLRIDNVGPEPYGAVAQSFPGRDFAGKTVRFSAWLKTRAADEGGAKLFLIAEFAGSIMAYNFMPGEEVKGTREWARHSLTLVIPAQADRIRVGATLEGKGTLWLDDAECEVAAGR